MDNTEHSPSMKRQLLVLGLNVAALVVACLVMYYRHQTVLFEDQDSLYLQVIGREFFTWNRGFFENSFRHMTMLGVPMLFNASYIPAFHVFASGLTGVAAKLAFFTILSIQMFLGMYVFARTLSIGHVTANALAWLCVTLVLPLFHNPVPLGQVYTVWPFVGHGATLLLFSLAMSRMLGRCGGPVRNLLALLGFITSSVLLCVTAIYSAPLVVPPLVLVFFVLLFAADLPGERLWKIGGTVFAAGVALTGPIYWAIGQIMYTARYTYAMGLRATAPKFYLVSSFFQTPYVSKFVFTLSIIGALLLLRHANKCFRYGAGALLLFLCMHAAYAVIVMTGFIDARSLPFPIYLEYVTTPFHALFVGYSLFCIWNWLQGTLRDKLIPRLPATLGRALLALLTTRLRAVTAVLIAVYFVGLAVSTFGFKKFKLGPALAPSSITEQLTREIGLKPGMQFAGRVCSFLMCGAYTDQEIAQGFNKQCTNEIFGFRPGLNNSHAIYHLWAYNIPTLDAYEQSISVAYYLLYSKLASHTVWQHTVSGISRFNLPLLAASGVRFVITPRPVVLEGLTPRSFIRVDAKGIVDQGSDLPPEEFYTRAGEQGYYLYELAKTNLGQYSPVVVRVVPDLQDSLKALGAADFDYSREVVLHEALPTETTLTPAKSVVMKTVPGGIRLEAESDGTSLLLLPYEYSHALAWYPDQGSAGTQDVLLRRADIAFTALRFSGRIGGELRFTFGPWSNPRARMNDLKDMRALGLNKVTVPRITGPLRFMDEL